MTSEEPPHVEEEEEISYLGIVNPQAEVGTTNDEVLELRAKLEKANHMIKTQNTAYQRAIRRAVLENDYVSKINSKLVQKVELQTREQGYSDKDLAKVQSVCEDMKQLIRELEDGKNNAEEKVRLLTSNGAKTELALSVQKGMVEELTSSVEALVEQNNKVLDKEALKSELLSLQKRKEELEKEKKGVSEALAVGNQSVSKDEGGAQKAALQLISEKEDLAKELLVMRLSHDKTTTELKSVQKRLEDAEQANEVRVSELTEAKRDVEEQIQELMISVEKMEAEAEAKEERIRELSSTIESAEEKNKRLLLDREKMEAETEAKEERIRELSSTVESAEKQNKALLADKEKMEAEAEAKEERIQELASTIQSSEGQNKMLLADKEVLNSELEKALEASTEAADTAMSCHSALSEQLVESKKEKTNVQQELDNLIREKEASDKVISQKLAEVEDENKRLTNSINSVMNELNLVNNDLNDSVTKPEHDSDDVEKSIETKVADNLSLISALRLKLRFFRKDNEDLLKSADEKDEKLAQMEKDMESFMTARDSDLAASASKLAAVEQRIMEEREKSDASIAEREAEREEAELSKVRIVELEDEVSKLKELETDLVSSKAQLEEEIEILQSEKKSLEENEVNQLNHIEKLKIEVFDGVNKAIELEESLEEERAEIQSISNRLEELTNDVENTVAEARAVGSAATTLNDVRTIMATDANRIANFKSQIKMLEAQKRDVEDTLLSVSNDKDEWEEKYESACEEMADLQEKLESAVGMGVAFVDKAEKYKKDVAALTTKRDAAEQLAKEYHTEIEANIAKCAQLEQTISSMQEEQEAIEKESKATIAKTNDRMNKRMADCDRQLITLLPPLHPARKDNLKFRDLISVLQKERQNVLEKIKTLEEEVEATQDESAILEQQVRILSKEVSKYKRQNKEILRALNEVTVAQGEDSDIPMDEVAVDTEVEKRLRNFKLFVYGRLSA